MRDGNEGISRIRSLNSFCCKQVVIRLSLVSDPGLLLLRDTVVITATQPTQTTVSTMKVVILACMMVAALGFADGERCCTLGAVCSSKD